MDEMVLKDYILPVLNVVVAGVVAWATRALVMATRSLAKETALMAKAMAQAQIALTLEANSQNQSVIEACITNTGNATAYDILIEYVASYKNGKPCEHEIPFHNISIFKPGQTLRASVYSRVNKNDESIKISIFPHLFDCIFEITLSWGHSPSSLVRESYSYEVSVSNLGDLGQIEGPLVSMSKSLDNIESHLKLLEPVLNQRKRLQIDAFNSTDRQAEVQKRAARIKLRRRVSQREHL